ncbi:MAG: rhizobiocin [Alphaproteobacteria bacterium]|nr:rhizobiocin [Alphaproteobacteria bacterium]
MALVKGSIIADTLSGGATADTILGDKGSDTLSGLAGNDLIDGGLGNDVLNGGADDDALLGGEGNDTMDGGTGDDFMYGGDGSDIYYVDSVNDVVEETDATSAGGGIDEVNTLVNWTLGSFIENGRISSFGSGGVTLTGNALTNTLVSEATGTNTLDGGAGADIMSGTSGGNNVVFLVDQAGDTIVGAVGASDTIVADLSWSLTSQSTGVENLTLSAAAGAGATATGNSGANILTANNLGNTLLGAAGNDSLVGGNGNDSLDGGADNDAMVGGLGNDTYFMDNASDTVTEAVGEGTDTVNAGFTYTLLANFENLNLTGTGAFNGTGNAADNIINGNSGDNSLDGVSGTDTLNGNGGNDVLFVHSGSEVIDGGIGTDTIRSDVSYNLNSAISVENLILLGSGNTDGTGTSGSNVLTGNTGNNTLDGGGAGGTDTMIGGLGNDTYVIYNTGDQITEGVGQGTDTVIANSISYTLSGDLENLTLQTYVKYGSASLTGTGNSGANVITDNSTGYYGTINNVLNGGGGNDTLVNNAQSFSFGDLGGTTTLNGGTGADAMSSTSDNRTVFVVDDAGDTVDGDANKYGQFFDEVHSSISWDLAVNTTDVRDLTLTGTAHINGAGTADGNSITGNTGNNTLSGLAGNDYLNGGDGNDTLDGGADVDMMIGGLGNDTFIVDNVSDQISEVAGQGTDTVISSVDYTLSGNIENLTITGAAVTAIGDSGTNIITGNGNDNTIDGAGGADAMSGGIGNDTYFVDNSGDQVFEVAVAGTDTVNASASFTISPTAEIEILNLTGSGNIDGTGNAGVNTITGNTGNNTLDGGAGLDTLIGGAGNDTYITDNPGDVLSEVAGEGTDTVIAGYTYTIAAEFENLTLSGTGDFNATGNAANNVLTGNSGNNTLDGLAGADSMEGGAGNDYFIVDNTGDVATDFGGGFDEVFASASFTLGSGIENLTLDTLVVGAIDGTGNNLDNVITGTDDVNFLQGLAGNDGLYAYIGNDTLDGGTGADSMFGGQGDDTYYVDNASDQVFENFGEGNDTVYSSVTFTLTGSNVENLILTGAANLSATGTGDNDNITGNSGNNTLTGLGGNDTLIGGGGVDRLVGGDGDDYYVIDSTTDVVVEANTIGSGTDTVQTSVTYLLAANVENGVITAAGTLTGSAGGNMLTAEGIGANITLNGGLGADLLVNDSIGGTVTHVVDNAGDSVEGSAMGTDNVVSSVSFDMDVRGDINVDNLTLTGSAALNGYGNAANNTINGNSGANILDGRGGDDHLNGGAGNDTYYVDSNGDVLTDTSGIETVFANGVDWTLGTGFEKLTLLGVGNNDGAGNTLANTITGNDGSNSLFGGSGNDTLIGGLGSDILEGGLGADRLTGGGDSDTFYWGAANQGADTITDFQQGGGGDALDFSDILVGYNGNVSEFIQITQSGANTIVKVDVNGLAGGSSFVTYATLLNVNLGTDETTVLGNGNLIVT